MSETPDASKQVPDLAAEAVAALRATQPTRAATGWRVLRIGVATLFVAAILVAIAFLTIPYLGGSGEGWLYIWMLITPLMSVAAALAIGLLLIVVAARGRLGELGAGEAAGLMFFGLILGPILSWIVAFAMSVAIELLAGDVDALMAVVTLVVPVAIGVVVVLVPARRKASVTSQVAAADDGRRARAGHRARVWPLEVQFIAPAEPDDLDAPGQDTEDGVDRPTGSPGVR